MKLEEKENTFIFIYEYFFNDVTFPLTNFEVGLLTFLNVALS